MGRKRASWLRFEQALAKVLSVSKEELDRRIAAYEAQRETLPRSMRPGPKPGTPPPHARTGGGRRKQR